jgi:hypothetical protein
LTQGWFEREKEDEEMNSIIHLRYNLQKKILGLRRERKAGKGVGSKLKMRE